MWGDASSVIADVGFSPENLRWMIQIEGLASVSDMKIGCLSIQPYRLSFRHANFVGICYVATVENCGSQLCLEGSELVPPSASSNWHVTMLFSRTRVAELANGCVVSVLQHSGKFSE